MTIPAAIPPAEADRIAVMATLRFAAAVEGPAFSALASVVRALLDLPVATVTVAETDALVLTSGAGVPATCRVDRAGTFCDIVIKTAAPLIVPDALLDDRFATSSHVIGPDNRFRFYAGIPLITSDGRVLGTLCGFDTKAREAPDPSRIAIVTALADASLKQLELEASQRLHREREAALTRRTELLEATLNSIGQGITAFDKDLRLQVWNKPALEILDFPVELIAKDLDLLTCATVMAKRGLYGKGDPDTLARERCAAAATMKRFEFERLLSNGRTVRLDGVPLPDGGFLTTYTDLTQERAQEAEIAYRTRYFKWQGAVDMICNRADDLDTAIRGYLDYACDEMAYDVAHVVKLTPSGLSSTGLFHRRHVGPLPDPATLSAMTVPSRLARRAAFEAVGTVIEDGGLDLGDLEPHVPRATSAGFAFPVQILSNLYVFELYGTVGITSKASHKSLIAHLEAAFSQVAERARIERLKDEFVSTIGAKLKAPLVSVQTILDRLPRERMSDEIRAMLDVTDLDSRRLGHLVDNLMVVHELDQGVARPALRAEDAVRLVGRAVRDQGGTDRVRLRADPGDLAVATDLDGVVLILNNLLSNALKFSPADEIVEVDIGRHAHGVRIAVRDHGPGIPDRFRPSLFGRFVQADSSDTRRIGGTGLGLAVARRLADSLGGSLDYRSAAGEGTTFVLDLPVALSLAEAA